MVFEGFFSVSGTVKSIPILCCMLVQSFYAKRNLQKLRCARWKQLCFSVVKMAVCPTAIWAFHFNVFLWTPVSDRTCVSVRSETGVQRTYAV